MKARRTSSTASTDSGASRMTLASESTLAGMAHSHGHPSPPDAPSVYKASQIYTPTISTTPTANTGSTSNPDFPTASTSSLELAPRHALRHDPGPTRPTNPIVAWMRSAALHTPPSFFSINMGCGMASILLYNFPYPAAWLRYLGTAVFVLNVIVFVLLLLATIARYLFFSGIWDVVAKHHTAGLFWGTFPMGFVTIVSMTCYVCVPAWGRRWAYIALGFWWVDVVVSVVVSLGMTFVMFTRQRQTVNTLAPQWLLPIVSCVVAAAAGATVSQALMPFNPALARGTLIASYCVWGLGFPLAMMVIALLVFRFGTGGTPRGNSLAAVFLPVGPCGQGSFGIATMGIVARRLAYEHDISIVPGLNGEDARHIASAMYAGSLIVALVLWGLAMAWYTLGMALFADGVRRDPKLLGLSNFSVSLWALTFPIGTFGTSSIILGTELQSTPLKVVGAFLAAQVILHCLYVSVFTAWKVVQGTMVAPELSGEGAAAPRPRFWSETVARDIEAGYGEPEASVESVPLETVPPAVSKRTGRGR